MLDASQRDHGHLSLRSDMSYTWLKRAARSCICHRRGDAGPHVMVRAEDRAVTASQSDPDRPSSANDILCPISLREVALLAIADERGRRQGCVDRAGCSR